MFLRYQCPSKFKDPKCYANHLILIFYPFRGKCALKVRHASSYSSKLSETWVLEIVNNNRSELVNAAFLIYRADITPRWNPFSQQKNEDAKNEFYNIELSEQTEITYPDDENQNN